MIEIIHSLRETSSRLEKEKILLQHKDNELWKEYLVAVLDDSVNYYIKSVTDNTFYSEEEYKDINLNKMLRDLKKISSRELTGNKARDFAIKMSVEYGQLFRLILSRSLKAGVTKTTINKIYGNLIPDFKVMLGKDVPVKGFPVLCSVKYDGIRLVVFVRPDGVEIKTRSGKLFPLGRLKRIMGLSNSGVYDCELVLGSGRVKDRQKISGEANKILKGTSTDIKDFTLKVFDYIPLEDWDNEKCLIPFYNRLELLEDNLIDSSFIDIVAQIEVSSNEEVQAEFDRLEASGFEGLILRPKDSLYEWKRSTNLIKRKSIVEFSLECVDVELGQGKYEGVVGALICEGYILGKFIKVKVGSGLSDVDRENVPDYFKGKTIEGFYNSVIRDKEGNYSLFLPRFKRIGGDFDV